MRNLKKLLALVLAMVMTFSLMLSASAAAADYDKYGDKANITPEFDVAVRVLTGLDVLKGDAGGFRPSDTLTRAEAAVIVYRVATGDVNDNQTGLYADYGKFADVKPEDWFAGYVGYCQNAGYIKGTTPTTFSPYQKVTGYQLLAMLLRVVGYGQNDEFVGGSWQVNVAALAEQLGITKTVKETNFGSTLNMPARRDVVAELTFKTIDEVPTVTYTPAMSYSDTVSVTSTNKNPTLGQKIFGLYRDNVDTTDDWGRPGYKYVKGGKHALLNNVLRYDPRTAMPIYNGGSTTVATIQQKADATFTKRIAECDIAHELNMTKSGTIEAAYIDGQKQTSVKTTAVTTDMGGDIGLYDTTSYVGGNGRITEVFKMGNDTYRLVEINTYFASVSRITPEYTDANGHKVPAYATLTVYVKSGDRSDSTDKASNWVWDDQKTTWNGLLDKVAASTSTAAADTSEGVGVRGTEAFAPTVTLYTEDVDACSGGFVLVTANPASLKKTVDSGLNKQTKVAATVKAATIVSGGVLTRWTVGEGLNPGTTTVGNGSSAITYPDADKFVLNRRTSADQALSVALDEYNNIIARVNLANYLVIEKIEWKHGAGIGDGYALADVILANGNKESGIKVTYVNEEPVNNVGDTQGYPGFQDADGDTILERRAATVSDYYQNNGAYYKHAFAYSVNSDGTYSLNVRTNPVNGCVDHVTTYTYPAGNPTSNNPSNPVDNNNLASNTPAGWINATSNELVTINRGQATIDSTTAYASSINRFVATDNTVFLVLNKDGYTYTTYVGKNNVPTMRNVNACFVTASGFASLVVVSGQKVEETTFLAYVGSDNQVAGTSTNGLGVAYNVYPMGDAAAKMVHDPHDLYRTVYQAPGIYEFTLNSNDQIITGGMKYLINDVSNFGSFYSLNQIDRADVSALNGSNTSSCGVENDTSNIIRVAIKGLSGNSLQTWNYDNYGIMASTSVPANNKSDVAHALSSVGDFNVTDDTKVIRIIRYNTNGDMTNGATDAAYLVAGTKSDLAYAGNKVAFIEFESQATGSNTRYYAKTVYILEVLKDVQLGQAVASTSKTWTLASNVGIAATSMTAYYETEYSDGTGDAALASAKANTTKLPLRYFNTMVLNSNELTVTVGSTETLNKVSVYTNEGAVPTKVTRLATGQSTISGNIGTIAAAANLGLGVGSRIVIQATDTTVTPNVTYFTVIEITADTTTP